MTTFYTRFPNSGAQGTVTSVDVSGGTTGLTTSGGPITTSGTITLAGTVGIANGGTNATSFTTNKLVYYNGTGIISEAASTVATSGVLLTLTAQAATDTPIVIKAAGSQSATLQEWRNSSNVLLSAVNSAGKLGVGATPSAMLTVTDAGAASINAPNVLITSTGATYEQLNAAVSSLAGHLLAETTTVKYGIFKDTDNTFGLFDYAGGVWAIKYTPSNKAWGFGITAPLARIHGFQTSDAVLLDIERLESNITTESPNLAYQPGKPCHGLRMQRQFNSGATDSLGGIYGYSAAAGGTGWAGGMFITTHPAGFGAGEFARLLIDPNGNVGINTLGPAASLEVDSTTAANPVAIIQGATSQSGNLIWLNGISSTTAARNQGIIDTAWADSTDATRKGRVLFYAADTANRECIRIEASGSAAMVGFLGASAVVKQTSGANLTNNVTSGGTDDVIANYTDLTVYANDAAAIRNDIYQLARKLKQVNDALRLYGLLT